ncbi:hypothetical protein AWJ14_07265 [Hoeflea olei]|uniref:Uncharacterized protein n=2 Tax=Hoeflea olei TaxID=1480615 RepID=A0A1C1YTT3_9HYPH|nr:hypothetical protein AWJ14_07265 [Hoeflea olei]
MMLRPAAKPAEGRAPGARAAVLLLAAGLALAPGASFAQAQATPEPQDPPMVDCTPSEPFEGGEAQPRADAAPDADLTAKLDACNGVITPPAVGDSDFTAPAPPIGDTPVIEPEDLPPQTSD